MAMNPTGRGIAKFLQRSVGPVARTTSFFQGHGVTPDNEAVLFQPALGGKTARGTQSLAHGNFSIGIDYSRTFSTVDRFWSSSRFSIAPVRLLSGQAAKAVLDTQDVVATKSSEGTAEDQGQAPSTKSEARSSYWGIVSQKLFREDGTAWPWHEFRPSETYLPNVSIAVKKHYTPSAFVDKLAYRSVRFLRLFPAAFFRVPAIPMVLELLYDSSVLSELATILFLTSIQLPYSSILI